MVGKLCDSCDVVCLAEARGALADQLRWVWPWRGSHDGAQQSSGGEIIILVPKKFKGLLMGAMQLRSVVPGRAASIHGTLHCCLPFYALVTHHSELAMAKLEVIQAEQALLAHWVRRDGNRGVGVIVGDFNFVMQGHVRWSRDGASYRASMPAAADKGREKCWEPMRSRVTGVSVGELAHVQGEGDGARSSSDDGGESVHRLGKLKHAAPIDRQYIDVPSPNLPFLDIQAPLLDCPTRLFREGISDHAPVAVAIAAAKDHRKPPAQRPIPKRIGQHHLFARQVCSSFPRHLASGSPAQAIEQLKDVFRKAARSTIDEIRIAEAHSPAAKASASRPVAGAVARND